MRQFGDDFATHIASGATTLCWCWRIERTDGVTLGFPCSASAAHCRCRLPHRGWQ
ncbi:MAG TPA: hypothetical protein DIT93_05295 [Pelagibacterium sp.]|uniref:baseplate hub domain-containing protein n=1 Tax=uncultured Pelagibacterium sp. TaxID=1159875 RepID=UPI000C69D91A|nr:hypothetical protein [Pelagibacterium sp.]HCO54417.1 hypothetical protein [Pelagibacterium sp.]